MSGGESAGKLVAVEMGSPRARGLRADGVQLAGAVGVSLAIEPASRSSSSGKEVDKMKRTSEMLKPMEATETTKEFMETLETLPSGFYLAGTIGSILLSLGLFLIGRRFTSLFVGLWAPTILLLTLFYKMMRPSREM